MGKHRAVETTAEDIAEKIYPAEKAAHTCGGPKFGRKTPGCPRCDQLINGAAPVRWSPSRQNSYGISGVLR